MVRAPSKYQPRPWATGRRVAFFIACTECDGKGRTPCPDCCTAEDGDEPCTFCIDGTITCWLCEGAKFYAVEEEPE